VPAAPSVAPRSVALFGRALRSPARIRGTNMAHRCDDDLVAWRRSGRP